MANVKKTRSRFYLRKENNQYHVGKFVVMSKVYRTGPKQIDDLVEFRGPRSKAKQKLDALQKKEAKLLSKGLKF